MLHVIEKYMQRPPLYAPSTAKFWDDTHISKGMLQAHLAPSLDSATRNYRFVQKSAQWIETVAPPQRPHLLDLGCGAGIYAELFDDAGYKVTGMDLSRRSLQYAQSSAQAKGKNITYLLSDYLTLDCPNEFDIVTLIYCDFGVLSTENRMRLLKRIYATLRPNGIFIFDVFTPFQYASQEECRHWEYEEGGFWSAAPYLYLESLYRYDEQNTFLQQYLVVTQREVNCYNIWQHTFTKEEIIKDLSRVGFSVQGIYGDISGAILCAESKQLCIVAKK